MQIGQLTSAEPVGYGEPLESASLIVYAIHGRDQSSDYMQDIADRTGVENIHWLFPNAQKRSWYPKSFLAKLKENEPALSLSLETLQVHITEASSHGLPVVLFGFSQGACLLTEYLLRDHPVVDGAILHTGGFMGSDVTAWNNVSKDILSKLEIRMFTSKQDPWVPLQRVKTTREVFEASGAAVELVVYDDPEHHVNEDAIHRIREFLTNRSR